MFSAVLARRVKTSWGEPLIRKLYYTLCNYLIEKIIMAISLLPNKYYFFIIFLLLLFLILVLVFMLDTVQTYTNVDNVL